MPYNDWYKLNVTFGKTKIFKQANNVCCIFSNVYAYANRKMPYQENMNKCLQ